MEEYINLLKGRKRSILMGVSIIWIIFFHFAMYGNLLRFPVIDFIFGKGYLGVDVFFFLSAYGLCHSLNKNTIKEFYVRRFQKLFPVYPVFLAILFLAFPGTRGKSWLLTGFYQISGISMFIPLEIEWFIPALIFLYLLFPLLYKGIRVIYQKGLGMTVLLLVLLSLISPHISGFVFYLFSLRLVIITLGILTYFALTDGNQSFLLAVYVLSAFIGVLYIGNDQLNVSMTGSLIIPLLLYGIGQIPFTAEKVPFLPFVGEHSLELYLAQCLAFNHFMASTTLTFIPTTLLSGLITLLVATALFLIQNTYCKVLRRK